MIRWPPQRRRQPNRHRPRSQPQSRQQPGGRALPSTAKGRQFLDAQKQKDLQKDRNKPFMVLADALGAMPPNGAAKALLAMPPAERDVVLAAMTPDYRMPRPGEGCCGSSGYSERQLWYRANVDPAPLPSNSQYHAIQEFGSMDHAIREIELTLVQEVEEHRDYMERLARGQALDKKIYHARIVKEIVGEAIMASKAEAEEAAAAEAEVPTASLHTAVSHSTPLYAAETHSTQLYTAVCTIGPDCHCIANRHCARASHSPTTASWPFGTQVHWRSEYRPPCALT